LKHLQLNDILRRQLVGFNQWVSFLKVQIRNFLPKLEFVYCIIFCYNVFCLLVSHFLNLGFTISESLRKGQSQSAAVIVTTNPSVDSGNQSDPYVEEPCKLLHSFIYLIFLDLTS